MESQIARKIALKHEPVAIILTDARPDKAKQFKEGKWGCVMFMLAAAVKGETAVFNRKTAGCQGGGTGLGFGNQYKSFPGGEACFCYFLSDGNEQWETGRQVAEQVKSFMRDEAYDNFIHGERYIKSPKLVEKFIENLPITDIAFEYVVFKPLKEVALETETPEVVVFLGDMDQIAALTILVNYPRETQDNVIFPYTAGCMSIGIYPFREARMEFPRAVLGLNDISARLYLKRLLREDVMSFAVPWRLYNEMEKNISGSFLDRHTWKDLMKMKAG